MHAFKAILLVAYTALAAEAATLANADARAKAICGDLGVLDISSVPEGYDASALRLCADHPLGRDRDLDGASLAPFDNGPEAKNVARDTSEDPTAHTFEERQCEPVASYGCSGNFCWKACGSTGQWCWTASQGGNGPWRECNSWQDCGTDGNLFGCGRGCVNNPNDCVCGC